MKLTLGIPTFNRVEVVRKNLQEIIENRLNLIAKILIIDNCSPDNTFEQLLEVASDSENIRIIKQNENIGFYGNILSLHENCSTKYLLINSDEDYFLPDAIKWLLEYLEDNDVNLLSGAVMFDDKLMYRSYNAAIAAATIRRAFNYASGLVYNNEAVKKHIPLLWKFKNNDFVWLYTPVATALVVYFDELEDCYESNIIISNKRHHEESQIEDNVGGKFYHIESRMRQIRSIPQFAVELKNYFGEQSHSEIDRWLESELSAVFNWVRHSIGNDPEKLIARYFERGLAEYCKKNNQPYAALMLRKLRAILGGIKRRVWINRL